MAQQQQDAAWTPVPSRYDTDTDTDTELWLSLTRAKTRSYGSTASVTATTGGRYTPHRVEEGDTLQGIALRYGVTMEQIKRANKLFSNDCIFLRHSLNIPVPTERPLFNGLSLESPDPEDPVPQEASRPSCSPPSSPPRPSQPEPDTRPPPPEELSAKDYLQLLDLQITRSKQAARRLKEEDKEEEEIREDEEALARPSSSYQEL